VRLGDWIRRDETIDQGVGVRSQAAKQDGSAGGGIPEVTEPGTFEERVVACHHRYGLDDHLAPTHLRDAPVGDPAQCSRDERVTESLAAVVRMDDDPGDACCARVAFAECPLFCFGPEFIRVDIG